MQLQNYANDQAIAGTGNQTDLVDSSTDELIATAFSKDRSKQ